MQLAKIKMSEVRLSHLKMGRGRTPRVLVQVEGSQLVSKYEQEFICK